MEIILLSKIERLGDLGDVVKVKAGYARNYLIPQKKAKISTPENIAKFEQRKAELSHKLEEDLVHAQTRKEKLDGLSVSIAARVSSEDKLFGSIGSLEIIKAIQNSCGEEVQKSEIRLPNGLFREIGTFPLTLALHAEVNAVIEINIIPAE